MTDSTSKSKRKQAKNTEIASVDEGTTSAETGTVVVAETADLFTNLPPLTKEEQQSLFVVEDDEREMASFKGDMNTMEMPVFSLSKNADTRIRTFSRAGKVLKVIPSVMGAATIFDKDILLYSLSQIVKYKEAGVDVGRKLKINVYPFLRKTGRSTGGAAYERVVAACLRLRGTTIFTNVKTVDSEEHVGFGLLEDFKVSQYTKNGKGALELEVSICDWMYRAALNGEILTGNPKYFQLGQGLERRLYEIGRKHCGKQPWFTIGLAGLKEKVGSVTSDINFKKELREIVRHNRLPDYKIAIDESSRPHKFVFLNSNSMAEVLAEASRKGRIEWLNNLLQQTVPGAKAKTKPAKKAV